jgi:hypothetical protein
MYFDVRKYKDNITIQEIIPPFINLENNEPIDNNVKSGCNIVTDMDNMYGSERLTINILNKQEGMQTLDNYNTGYGNVCLYKFILVKEYCIYNDKNTTGLVLEPFEFKIKNNDNPTLSDCHNLLFNPKIIYNIKHRIIISMTSQTHMWSYFNKIYYNNQLLTWSECNKIYYNNKLFSDDNKLHRIGYPIYTINQHNVQTSTNIEPSVKDFLRRYFEYNQKIASTDINYIKKITDNKEQIEKELGLFATFLEKDSFTINLEKHNYMYFYILQINGIWCLRFGLTEQDLFQTFTRQLLIDHFTKNIDTFRLLAIYDYESKTIAENTEQMIKEGLKSFILEEKNLIIGYSFFKSWNLLNTYITNGMMFSKSFIRPEIENEIKKILKNP